MMNIVSTQLQRVLGIKPISWNGHDLVSFVTYGIISFKIANGLDARTLDRS